MPCMAPPFTCPWCPNGIHDLADVVGGGEAKQLHLPGLGVDGDLGNLGDVGGHGRERSVLELGLAGDGAARPLEELRPWVALASQAVSDGAVGEGQAVGRHAEGLGSGLEQLALDLLGGGVGHLGADARDAASAYA